MSSTRPATFLLGAPEPGWLERTDTPLFVSHTRLSRRRSLPRARGRWALDSGGFTELSRHGRWTVPARDYARAVRRYRDEIGGMAWASPQDWMCEDQQIRRTGLNLGEHQRRTVDNFLELREYGADLPIIPVLQGLGLGHYERCWELYERAGIDLAAEPLVGLGTVCRRQATTTAAIVVDALANQGLRLHGFGVKLTGLAAFGNRLASADSQAWSSGARARREPCEQGRTDCRNCLHYAEDWADEVGARLALAGGTMTGRRGRAGERRTDTEIAGRALDGEDQRCVSPRPELRYRETEPTRPKSGAPGDPGCRPVGGVGGCLPTLPVRPGVGPSGLGHRPHPRAAAGTAPPPRPETPVPTAKRIDVDGRPHINRAEIAARTGIGVQAQRNLYVARADNGHPDAVLRGREAFFDEQLADDWYAAWAASKRAKRRPAEVDGGDPEELLDLPAATRFLGYNSQSTIRGYLSRNDGYFPDADDLEDLPSGRVRRRWKRSTLREFAARPARPGRAHRS